MRKLLTSLLVCLMLPSVPLPVFATWNQGVQWIVETTGADTNGGCYDPTVGSPGTDESTGAGTAITITLTGTTTGTASPAFSSTTHGPGNCIHIASGTGCTAGWYEILSQSSGTATFSTAMGSSTDVCTGVIGGSLQTPGQFITNINSIAVNYNTLNLQKGTYSVSSSSTLHSTGTGYYLSGFNVTKGDLAGVSCSGGNCPTITTATNSVNLLTSDTSPNVIANVNLTNTAGTPASGFVCNGSNQVVLFDQVTFSGFKIVFDGNTSGTCTQAHFHAVEVKNSVTTASPTFVLGTSGLFSMTGSYVHDNTNSNGIIVTSSGNAGVLIGNTFYNNSPGSTAMVSFVNPRSVIRNNNFVSTQGASSTALADIGASQSSVVENNVFYNNAGTACSCNSFLVGVGGQGGFLMNVNAFGSNLSNGTTGTGAITLTADPFTSKSSGNFSLNSTAGGGALLKAAGFPGTFPGGTTTGYIDVGAAQSQASGGSSSSVQTTVQN